MARWKPNHISCKQSVSTFLTLSTSSTAQHAMLSNVFLCNLGVKLPNDLQWDLYLYRIHQSDLEANQRWTQNSETDSGPGQSGSRGWDGIRPWDWGWSLGYLKVYRSQHSGYGRPHRNPTGQWWLFFLRTLKSSYFSEERNLEYLEIIYEKRLK